MLKSKLFGKKTGFQEVEFSCTVNFLSEQDSLTVAYNKEWLGSQLFAVVCAHLNLAEKDFFALRYLDNNKHRCWIDAKKLIRKQAKNVMEFEFRVRFYPSDPSKLKEQLTRYLLFVQLERDLKHGRLLPSSTQLIQLSALQLQAHYEDCEIEDVHEMLSKNARYFSQQVLQQRNNMRGTEAAEAESTFIHMCLQLPTYGVDPVPARDMMGEMVFVGMNHAGVIILKDSCVAMHLPWKEVVKVDYHAKLLTIRSPKGGSTFLKLLSTEACKLLWKSILQQQAFFTLEWSGDARKVRANRGLFRRSSSFRFKGLCESEVWRSVTSLNRIEPPVYRSLSRASYNLGGSQSVPPSLTTSSFNHSGSLRSTSPPISPILPRLPLTEEDETPKAEEADESITAVIKQTTETAKTTKTAATPATPPTPPTPLTPIIAVTVAVKQAGRQGEARSGVEAVIKEESGCADEDFHSISEHSELMEGDAEVLVSSSHAGSTTGWHEGGRNGGREKEGGLDKRGERGDELDKLDGLDNGDGDMGSLKRIEHLFYKHAILLLFIAILYALFSFDIIF